ncbi:MAG: lipid II flippase MurJ, partial [Anaerovorax sp.]
MNNKKIAQTTIVVTIILIVSKMTGFLRDVALAYAYGTSVESDAFVLALSAVGIFSMLFGAIAAAFMPIYKAFSENRLPLEKKKFLDATYSIIGGLSCITVILGIYLSGIAVRILAPGFTGEVYELSVAMTCILLCTVPFAFFVEIGSQHLRGENSF